MVHYVRASRREFLSSFGAKSELGNWPKAPKFMPVRQALLSVIAGKDLEAAAHWFPT